MTKTDGRTPPRVAVIYGGPSEEREVSIESGTAVAAALRAARHPVVEIPIDESVRPHLERIRAEADVVFIALHGRYGEDGTVQAELEEAALAYTGSGPEASLLGMVKSRAKRLFEAAGIDTPKYRVWGRSDRAAAQRPTDMALPLVVKPDACGSSIGVSIARDVGGFAAALEHAWSYGDNALVEEYVMGRELTVGVLGSEALPAVELVTSHEFFDYGAKYSDGVTRVECPARLEDDTRRSVRDVALRAFAAIGARDLGRVDVLLRRDGRPTVLEVNTIPGFTSHSLFPRAAAAADIGFPEFASRIVAMAAARNSPP
jgi:D-alanine-D-alanine ligase